MTEEPERLARSERFRAVIVGFIDERRVAKSKGQDENAEIASKYGYTAWLADAARRVGQIQAVTHVLKASHPDARGSSLHVLPTDLPAHTEVGSHSLGTYFSEDVVGNAAALDVFKFLKLDIDGRRLLDWMRAGDQDLAKALHPDSALAAEWMAAFKNLVRSDEQLASHEAAKQLYWCIGDDATADEQFHLLQPLFASSLAHAVHGELQEARFGDSNKAAAQAFRAKQPSELEYRYYPGLAMRKLGGTKPQNISQLNSERGGINYLLASLPPQWSRERPRNLLHLDSALKRFGFIDEVRHLLGALAALLLADAPSNRQTRDERIAIEQALGQQLLLFAATIHARFEPGWSRDEACRLSLSERCWLDPERAALALREEPEQAQDDLAFQAAYDLGDWPDEVAGRFANWVNERLREAGVSQLGDAEYRHWARQAVVDASWAVPMQRRGKRGGL